MSKLDYCFEQYKSPNVHAIKKIIWDDMLGSIPHQKFYFIIYLLEDEQELSLGMLICLQCIYNFRLFHAVILSILDVSNHFIVILYHFLVLTYWHSAKCQLLFFCMFFTLQEINIKRSPYTVKLFVDFLWTKRLPMGQSSTWGCLEGGTYWGT